MKIGLKIAAAGVCSLALASSALVLGATAASASTTGNGGVTVGWQPDPNNIGTLDFYNSSGQQITTGSTTAVPMAAYYASNASGAPSGYIANTTPELGNSQTWSGTQQSTSTQTFPKTGLPGVLAGFGGAVVADNSAQSFQANQIAIFPNGRTEAGYQNLYEVRMYVGTDTAHWYAADIQVTGSTWTQVFPNQTAPTVTLSSPSANPSITGTAIQVTATLGTAYAGTVQFSDNGTAVGSSVAVSGTTATLSTTPAAGSHSYTAAFTPTPGTAGLASASTTPLAHTVNAPATSTTTSLVVSSGTYANDPATFTATVTPTAAAGSVVFKDNGTSVGTGTAGANNTYSLTTTALGAGNHSITAEFTPTNATAYNASTSAPSTFSYQGSPTVGPADPQNVSLTVAPGIVTITTPYTATNPFNLGTLALNPAATLLTGSALFPATGDNPITITDTRAGNLTWHAVLASGDLTGRTSASNKINGENFGFAPSAATYPTGNALFGKVVVSTTAPAAGVAPTDAGTAGLKGGPTFAAVQSGQSGVGTAFIRGQLSMQAPTSTVADTYDGVITFTVIGS